MANNKKKCFVIMPFSDTALCTTEKWTEIFDHIIKPAVEECDFSYDCKRFDLGRASVVKDILEGLNSAQLVIADLTDNNPNVMWELGIRHTLKRRTVLIAQDKKFLPSDLQDYPVIIYDQTKAGFDKFKANMKKKLEDIEKEPDKPDSPVADFLGTKNIDLLSVEKSANLKKISALMSEISYNIFTIENVFDTLKQDKFPLSRLSVSSLELLLSTSYITLEKDALELIRNMCELIKLVNTNLEQLFSVRSKETTDKFEERLIENLPNIKDELSEILTEVAKIRTAYIGDNYQEPREPLICLASPEHEKYLKLA